MNIFELACFIGLPSVVAFVLLIGVPHAFRLSLAIGTGSAFVSLLSVILFGYIYRLSRERRLQRSPAPIWAVLAVILSTAVALYFRFHGSPNHPAGGGEVAVRFVFDHPWLGVPQPAR